MDLSGSHIIGIIKVNKKGDILYLNKKAKSYHYYLDKLIGEALKSKSSFCFLPYPADVECIYVEEGYAILINPMDDIVRLKKDKRSLLELRSELDEVINSSFDGIVITDNMGKIIHQNPSYETITGLSAKDCIGRYLSDLESEGVIDSSASLQALSQQKEVTIIQKINTGVTVLVSAVPIKNKKGKIEKIVNNVRDLTHLNMLESEIQKLEKQNKEIHDELSILKEQNDPKFSIIAHSPKMKGVLERSLKIAQIDSGVLIQGDSGVGKEKIVELIHRQSFRHKGPLIKINCGAIPENLLESELFGYDSGSFTGAKQSGKAGLFETANTGIIFLDEIGEMPIQLQVRLLRVLQEHEITRVGGRKPIKIDIRVIAATNKDLMKMVKEGDFREDLFFRLNVIPLVIPPLKDRKDDIIPLTFHFLKVIKSKYGITRSLSKEALKMFEEYTWPGNVRELENVTERVALMSNNPEITKEDIEQELQFYEDHSLSSTIRSNDENYSNTELSLREKTQAFEGELIREALADASSIRKAASVLQIDQSTLVRKIKKYDINSDS